MIRETFTKQVVAFALGVALAGLAAGCATSPQDWKSNGSVDALTRDYAECQLQARMASGPPPVNAGLGGIGVVVAHRHELYKLCMQARGYVPAR
jgi:hypothetical protein